MNRFQGLIQLREAFGGRRFLLTVGCGLVTSVLCGINAIGGEVYATVILGTVGAYIAGNVMQKIKQPPGEFNETETGV